MDVILEVDRRGGVFTGGHDAYGHLRVDYTTAAQVDWAAQINGWLRDTLATRPAGYGGHGMRSRGGYGHAHRGHGRGLGGVAAGAAAGFVGGMVAGEVLGEVFDDGEDFGFEE